MRDIFDDETVLFADYIACASTTDLDGEEEGCELNLSETEIFKMLDELCALMGQ